MKASAACSTHSPTSTTYVSSDESNNSISTAAASIEEPSAHRPGTWSEDSDFASVGIAGSDSLETTMTDSFASQLEQPPLAPSSHRRVGSFGPQAHQPKSNRPLRPPSPVKTAPAPPITPAQPKVSPRPGTFAYDPTVQDWEDEDSLAVLDRMIDEASNRWHGSANLGLSPLALIEQQQKEEPQQPSTAMVVSPAQEDNITDSHREIIAKQQAEIEYLRQQLLRQPSAGTQTLNSPPAEEIDQVPVEQIELVDCDHLSVTSGLTNLQMDMSRQFDDSSFVIEPSVASTTHGPRRPEADQSSVAASTTRPQQQPRGVGMSQQRVRNEPVTLKAANGTVRQASYSGPIAADQTCTGIGILKFSTGDLYMGNVVNGNMHGQGTYTFKNSKMGGRVLKGLFENNVYIGYSDSTTAEV